MAAWPFPEVVWRAFAAVARRASVAVVWLAPEVVVRWASEVVVWWALQVVVRWLQEVAVARAPAVEALFGRRAPAV